MTVCAAASGFVVAVEEAALSGGSGTSLLAVTAETCV